MFKIIIDANVWIKYARVKNIAPLLSRFIAYDLLPFTNNYMLSEIYDATVDNNWMSDKQASATVAFIRRITSQVVESAVYRLSPDPKDNYLFDLAIQNNCIFIITDDKELLELKLKPVPVHTSGWFLKKFPVLTENS